MTSSPTRTLLDLDGSWSIGDKIHGGYLLAEIVRAALADGTYPHPLGVSAHFASAPDPGAADLDIATLRAGRRVATFRAGLSQEGAVRAEVLISAGTLQDAAPRYVDLSGVMPALPDPDSCERAVGETPTGVRIGPAAHFDMRMDPATGGWVRRDPSGEGVIRGWIRRPSGEAMDPYWLLIAGDAPPPVTFNLGIPGWVPTVTLDAHVRALPATGWLVFQQRATVVGGGWLDETCNLWDANGTLVASVRQLAGYRE